MQAHTPHNASACSLVCTTCRPFPLPSGFCNARAPTSPRSNGFCATWGSTSSLEFGATSLGVSCLRYMPARLYYVGTCIGESCCFACLLVIPLYFTGACMCPHNHASIAFTAHADSPKRLAPAALAHTSSLV